MKQSDAYAQLLSLMFEDFRVKKERNELLAKNKENYKFDKQEFNRLFQEVRNDFPEASKETFDQLCKKLSSYVQIYQEEGEALLGDYNHVDWYPNETAKGFFWSRYKSYLVRRNPSMLNTIQSFESNTDKITNLFGDPKSKQPFQVRGLVIGDVQSGKTSTYIGTICKAVDAGYRVVILLTGTVESLRRQTQIRVDEGFVGYDSEKSEKVGVGRESSERTVIPRSLTSSASDYSGSSADKNTSQAINFNDPTPLIYVSKKNTKVLQKIIKGLKSINSKGYDQKIDAPLLLIDDEADNASINTNKKDEDPTKVNAAVRKLLSLFKQATYVGFTATPFANVFIEPDQSDEMLEDDLFPKDFIFALKAPSDYFGAKKIFVDHSEGDACLVPIDDFAENSDLFSFNHKKDWQGQKLFPSFYDSVIAFCLANAIRDLRGDVTEHRSMLINMSRFTDVQYQIKGIVEDFLKEIKHSTYLFGCSPDEKALKDPVMLQIRRVWEKQYSHLPEKWEDVKRKLCSSINPIVVRTINCKSKEKLDYLGNKSKGLRVIAVGGLALSRGLTLEGLVVSYFFRNTSTYDVLMQMGRWFGYRPNYTDLVRIWITDESVNWFKEVAKAIVDLRADITRMNALKISPKEFGIRVRNDSEELGITAPNKMRNAMERAGRSSGSYYGKIFETSALSADYEANKNNWDLVKWLCQKVGKRDPDIDQQPYFRNVNKDVIGHLVDSLNVPDNLCQFDKNQIADFIRENGDSDLDNWDVLFVSRKSDYLDPESAKTVQLPNGIVIFPILRSVSLRSDGLISISGKSSHIGSRDTKNGLTTEQIKKVEEARETKDGLRRSTSQRDYMIQGRNPLLIVYIIKVRDATLFNNRSGGSVNVSEVTPDSLFPGFSCAFPMKEGSLASTKTYMVNSKADYYRLKGYSSEDELFDDSNEEDE